MRKWERPRPCWCSGYWFPHRLTSGACEHNPVIGTQVRILGKRYGWTDEENLDAFIDLALSTPGVVGKECPF